LKGFVCALGAKPHGSARDKGGIFLGRDSQYALRYENRKIITYRLALAPCVSVWMRGEQDSKRGKQFAHV
jgi:hypothetical protein